MLYLRVLHGQKNFGESVKKIPQKDLKVKEVLCTRDIWGRLVYLAAVQNLELEYVIAYPMTIFLLSLAHIHGAVNRTDEKTEKSLIKSGILEQAEW